MARKEKEFHRGQNVLVMDMKSGTKKQAMVFDFLNLINPRIVVRNSDGEVLFDKETLEGKTIYGPCVLRHTKV